MHQLNRYKFKFIQIQIEIQKAPKEHDNVKDEKKKIDHDKAYIRFVNKKHKRMTIFYLYVLQRVIW